MNPDHCGSYPAYDFTPEHRTRSGTAYGDDCSPPVSPRRKQWRCYLYFDGSVLESDVEAATAEDAAVLAASQHKIPGKWTVVPGDAVTVDIAITTQYIVRGPTS